MAADSEPRRKGLSLSNPGAKEYVIVGGTVLGLALAYFWWKGRHSPAPAAPAAGPSAPAGGQSPTGLSREDIRIWITDHASGPRRPGKRKRPEPAASPEPRRPPVTPAR